MSTRPRGVTLVELIVFIVIVGLALSALFSVFGTITKASADPQARKQVLAIAESLMDEVALMPFTFCDPDDSQAATATTATVGATGCLVKVEAIGPEAQFSDPNPPNAVLQNGTEDRYGTTAPFDNVNDYDGFNLPAPPGIKDINGTAISGLDGYSASITVSQAGLSSGADAIAASEALKITVTVNGPNGVSATLEGYRTRYAPNTVP
jgi:MSHA pilin protein MshD